MSRWRAFAIHLALSLLVIGSIAFGLFSLWYPPQLLGFAQADRLFLLIAGIDIVVGPVLTLIVYRAGKKSLKFDLAVIAVLQLAFLGTGLWTSWASRPVYLVAAVDRYELVFANEIEAEDLAKAPLPQYRRLTWLGPEVVGLRKSETNEEFTASIERDKSAQPLFYVAPEASVRAVLERALRPAELGALASFWGRERIPVLMDALSKEPESLWVPLTSSRGSVLVQLDPQSGFPLRYVDPMKLDLPAGVRPVVATD